MLDYSIRVIKQSIVSLSTNSQLAYNGHIFAHNGLPIALLMVYNLTRVTNREWAIFQ